MGPSAIHETGHFYFAQTGHSHFAATASRADAAVAHLASNHIPALIFQLRSTTETAISTHESKLA